MKDIPGYKGRYAVTEDGRVWSHPKLTPVGRNGGFRKDGDCWLNLRVDNRGNGYYRLTLIDDNGNRKPWLVHRLVAATYIPNPDNLPFVNHINGVTTDNRVENLEWCDASGNSKHAFNSKLIRIPNQSGKNNSQANLTIEDVVKIRNLSKGGMKDVQISKSLGICKSTVNDITRYRTWKDIE